MARRAYSYKLRRTVSLLNEAEWDEIRASGIGYIEAIKAYRAETGASLGEARAKTLPHVSGMDRHFERTGDRVYHADEIWALRAADYGRLCPRCGKPFRTPRAKICAECGFNLPPGQVAGPFPIDE